MTCEELLKQEIDTLSKRLAITLNKKNCPATEIDNLREKIKIKNKTLEIVLLDQARKRGF